MLTSSFYASATFCSPLASFRTSAHSSEHGCSPPPSTLRPARGGLLARDRCALDRGARRLPQRVRLRLQHAGSRGVDWRLGAMRAGRPEERGAANRTLRYRSRRGPRLEEVALPLLAPRGAGDQVALPAFPQCVKFGQVHGAIHKRPTPASSRADSHCALGVTRLARHFDFVLFLVCVSS